MTDAWGRTITYARVSLTDRCNMHCVYCNPRACSLPHTQNALSVSDLSRIARIFSALGITKIRLTGGEPLLRDDLADIVRLFAQTRGISDVALTTNGVLFAPQADALWRAGLRSVNISLDATDAALFSRMTGFSSPAPVFAAIDRALSCGFAVKVNAVICQGMNESQMIPLARLAQERPVSVRFIELMPLGFGKKMRGVSGHAVQTVLENAFGTGTEYRPPHSPARYVQFPQFAAPIGFISPVSHAFCADCNRIRLTSDGTLKCCLAYDAGLSLPALLAAYTDDEVCNMIIQAVQKKPAGHRFFQTAEKPPLREETKAMVQIGG